MMEIRKPLDIADVKAGINAGRLYLQIKDGLLMLGDYQTGEAVRLSDIKIKPVVHARWRYKVAYVSHAHVTNIIWCSACNDGFHRIEGENFKFCPNCGARMDGDPHDGGQ